MKDAIFKSRIAQMTGSRFLIFFKKHKYSLFFLAIAFVFYGNTIPNEYSLDDPLVIQDNPKVHQGIKGIPLILRSPYFEEEGNTYGYRPLPQITFALEYEIWGENPHISHLVNLLLYALILILLFIILKRILQKYNLLFPFLITLLFAGLPIHTEVIASLKNR